MPQEKISSVIKDRVPRFVLEEYPNFVNFLDAYNRFLENDRKIKVSLAEFISILDRATAFDTGFTDQPTFVDNISSFDIVKGLFDAAVSDDSGLYLTDGKRLADISTAKDILSREIRKLFNSDSSLVTDGFKISDITRGVVDTILALDTISKSPQKYPTDSSVTSDTLLPFSTTLGKSDQPVVLDSAAFSTDKPLTDTAILLDVAAKTLSTNQSEFISSIADTITSKAANLQKLDNQSLADAIVEKIAYPLYQETTEALENFSIQEYTSTQEQANALESIQSIGTEKLVLDSVTQLDSILVEIFYGYRDEILSADSISISLNSLLVDTGDYMSAVGYAPENYFGGSIDDNLTAI